MAETIRGFAIVAEFRLPPQPATRPGRIILVDRGPEEPERWVTALHCDGDRAWLWGHYFSERAEADADFKARGKRGY